MLLLLVLLIAAAILFISRRGASISLETKFNRLEAPRGGLLISMVSDADAARMISAGRLEYADFDQCAAVNRKTCSAWSYLRRDLWPAAFIIPGMGMNIGFIADPARLWPLITTMSVIDGDTNFRSACSNENGSDTWLTTARADDCMSAAFKQGPYAADSTGQVYMANNDAGSARVPAKCAADDKPCRYLNSGAGINVWDLMYNWPCQECGEFRATGTDNIYYGSLKNCKACDKPYLCRVADPPASGPNPTINADEIAAYVGADSKLWPALFTKTPPNIGYTAVHQCKYERDNWPAWVAALKEFYKYLLANPLTLDPRAPVYLENEVNTYIFPDRAATEYKRQQDIFLKSIVGIFYIDDTCEDQIKDAAACNQFFSRDTAARRAIEAAAKEQARKNVSALVKIFKDQTGRKLQIYAARLQSNTFVDKKSLEDALAAKIEFKNLFRPVSF